MAAIKEPTCDSRDPPHQPHRPRYPHVIGDDPGVRGHPRGYGLDLAHQVRTDIGRLGKYAASNPGKESNGLAQGVAVHDSRITNKDIEDPQAQ